jgi:hypothetical protein
MSEGWKEAIPRYGAVADGRDRRRTDERATSPRENKILLMSILPGAIRQYVAEVKFMAAGVRR